MKVKRCFIAMIAVLVICLCVPVCASDSVTVALKKKASTTVMQTVVGSKITIRGKNGNKIVKPALKSSNTKVMSVKGNVVEAKKTGTAVVTVTYKKKNSKITAKIKFNVKAKASGLTKDHTHKWQPVSIARKASHDQPAVVAFKCSCGKTMQKEVGTAMGHHYELVGTENGKTTLKCACGKTYTYDDAECRHEWNMPGSFTGTSCNIGVENSLCFTNECGPTDPHVCRICNARPKCYIDVHYVTDIAVG